MAGFGEIDPRKILKDLYGFDAEPVPLPGEHDRNFSFELRDKFRFVLKVMRADPEPGLVELQCAALEHLIATNPKLAIPRLRRPKSGPRTKTTTDADGKEHAVWVLDYLPGRTMASATPHTPKLLGDLGSLMGQIDDALSGWSNPAADRELKWDLAGASWIRDHLDSVGDGPRRAVVERVLDEYEHDVVPVLPDLRRSIIHNDANDYNVLVDSKKPGAPLAITGVIDFGDMLRTVTVAEPAIAAAYALLGKHDPLAAAGHVVTGYHSAYPLEPTEVAVLFPLIRTRLAVSVVNSAIRREQIPDDPYVTVSEDAAWEALERLAEIHPRFAHYSLRGACGWDPVPASSSVVSWLQTGTSVAPVLDANPRSARCTVVDLGAGSLLLGADPAASGTAALTETLDEVAANTSADIVVGRYDEARPVYTSPIFAGDGNVVDERRTIHLGIDLFVDAGAPLYAPLAGTVHVVANNARPQDYGPLVILRHTTGDGDEFFTLYGHLGEDTFDFVSPGDRVSAGQRIGSVGAPPVNGDWPPHLHFQLIVDLLELNADYPGVGFASQRDAWRSLSPDPNVLLGIPKDAFPPPDPEPVDLMRRRIDAVGKGLRVSYQRPLEIVRGWMQYLYDDTGRAYIDLYNNVPHVGHSHPRVVDAVCRQAALLNTNTRYLHEHMVNYAERLAATMPEPLGVCYFLNSASEANELALRLSRAHTGQRDIIVHEAAYHGHTTTMIDISPYKFDGPGGEGAPPGVHVAPIADDYRGAYKRTDPDAGRKYAAHVGDICARLRDGGGGPAAFIAESCPSVGGQIIFPPGYLDAAYRHVRDAGGVCIADEVQTGFGRLGTHFWGFETQDVVPDIVVLGKPIGNGFPLAAVVATREIAVSFNTGMEFFSTFGGNPVACAAGLAVLDVVEEEGLQERALRLGQRLRAGLEEIKGRFAIVGDVRGSGLFTGVELVRDRESLEPAREEASYVVNRLREKGVLAGTDGPFDNVVKLRGPLALTPDDIDLALEIFNETLGEDPAGV